MAAKIRISSDSIKLFYGKGDVEAWICKIKVVVRRQSRFHCPVPGTKRAGAVLQDGRGRPAECSEDRERLRELIWKEGMPCSLSR